MHGFAYQDYLTELDTPSDIFAESASVDMAALEDCFTKTRKFLMDSQGLTEPETIALMGTGCEFDITQIVDGNWGVHASTPKWLFEDVDVPYDYMSTSNPTGDARKLTVAPAERERKLQEAGVDDEMAETLFRKITGIESDTPGNELLKVKFVDAKLFAAEKYDRVLAGVSDKIIAALEAKGTIEYVGLDAKLAAALADAEAHTSTHAH